MRFLIYILLLLGGAFATSQNLMTEKDFNSSIKRNGVVVIEFWAEWNKQNECKYLKDLEGCNTGKVCIESSTTLAEKYNIKVLPTLVIINNSEEICRFKGNLLFKLDAKEIDVQEVIDSIIISKFE